jgi:hypothetical protein
MATNFTPVKIVRWSQRGGYSGSLSLPTALPPGSVLRPVAGLRRTVRGRTYQPALPPVPLLTPPGSVMRPVASVRRHSAGRTWMPSGLTPPPALFGASIYRPVAAIRTPARSRSTWSPRLPAGPPPSPFARFAGPLLVRAADDSRRRRRAGWLFHCVPAPCLAAGYHVYGNGGAGPIDYTTPIAIVAGLTWTSAALAYPDDWWFAVRAFNVSGEEKNLEAAIELRLDATGRDITNLPLAPTGLRAFPTAGGGIRVEWTQPAASRARQATGFHIYIVSPLPIGGPLCPTAAVRRGSRRRGRGSSGEAAWRRGDGGSAAYGTPAATVLYASSVMGSWVCNLAGLTDDTVYTIGVRAYNAASEEANTNTVSATADRTGPAAVDSLTATATV